MPPATRDAAIRQPIAEMAREAVRLLVEQIRGRRNGADPQVAHKMLKFTLVKRASSAPPEPPSAASRAARRKP